MLTFHRRWGHRRDGSIRAQRRYTCGMTHNVPSGSDRTSRRWGQALFPPATDPLQGEPFRGHDGDWERRIAPATGQPSTCSYTSEMRIIVTGDRNWYAPDLAEAVLNRLLLR